MPPDPPTGARASPKLLPSLRKLTGAEKYPCPYNFTPQILVQLSLLVSPSIIIKKKLAHVGQASRHESHTRLACVCF